MTDEKPTSEQDAIAAALSALSNAAAPVRETDAPEEAAPTTPPPPPAPESTEDYPAPTGAPVSVTTAASTSVVPPAPATKRKKWPWVLALCIVAGVVLLGGMAACASAFFSTAFHAVQHNERYHDYDEYFFDPNMPDGLWNYYFGNQDVTFDEILDMFHSEAGSVTPGATTFEPGTYRVSGEAGIAPGLYYLQGTQTGVSHFYVFRSEGDDGDEEALYSLATGVEFFGNYYTELEEGDVIVFQGFDRYCQAHLATDPMDVTPPYQSGCYRVGIDIPAGTYTITCDADAARETDSEAGAYIMQDLAFEEDSILESVYVIKGGRQTITVQNGQYLELFAAIATPATASTKTPLQPAENGAYHAA